jgi:sugar/nucleoside kinase (ribokinase family)
MLCAVGTTMVDIYVYSNYLNLMQFNEVDISSMEYKIGGSVYNSISLLSLLGIEHVFHTYISNDIFSAYLKNGLEKNKIKYVSNKVSSTSMSIMLMDNEGEKKILSHVCNNGNVIYKRIFDSNDEYSGFFLSAYSINNSNHRIISQLLHHMTECKAKTILDLCPLIYTISKVSWQLILPYLSCLIGTYDEINILCNTLGININEIMDTYNISKVYVKKGKDGCSVICASYKENNFLPNQIISSTNLTGCGDAFNAGVIYGELRNLTINDTINLAQTLALNVAKYGLTFDYVVEETKLLITI